MNKSWGPRKDWGGGEQGGTPGFMLSLGPHPGAFLLVLGLEFENKEAVYGPFKFGYVVVDGERRPLVRAVMRAQRFDMLVTRAVVELEDDRRRRSAGSAVGTCGRGLRLVVSTSIPPARLLPDLDALGKRYPRRPQPHRRFSAGLAHLSRGMADKHDT